MCDLHLAQAYESFNYFGWFLPHNITNWWKMFFFILIFVLCSFQKTSAKSVKLTNKQQLNKECALETFCWSNNSPRHWKSTQQTAKDIHCCVNIQYYSTASSVIMPLIIILMSNIYLKKKKKDVKDASGDNRAFAFSHRLPFTPGAQVLPD